MATRYRLQHRLDMLLVQTLLIMDESLHRFFKSISFRVSAITTPLMQQSNNNSTFLIIIVFFVCTNLEKTSISCSSKSVTKTRKSVTICLLRLPQSSCDKDSYLRNIIETYLQPYFSSIGSYGYEVHRPNCSCNT